MKQSISFNLNGKPVSVEANGDESLLTVIRTYLDHTGTKYGCGMGHCGSCTVLIDKEPVRSCMIYVEDVVGKEITTIEGLAKGRRIASCSEGICRTRCPPMRILHTRYDYECHRAIA